MRIAPRGVTARSQPVMMLSGVWGESLSRPTPFKMQFGSWSDAAAAAEERSASSASSA